MSFSSLSYAFFLSLILGAAVAAPGPKWRQVVLLTASYVFYATWNPRFLLLLIAASWVNHFWGAVLRRRCTPGNLWIGLAFNLSLLGGLKYLPAATGFDLVAPIGLSFFTFQAISHLLDIYRGDPEEQTWLEFFLYMAFWPTILSGPICRLREMLPQYRAIARPRWCDISIGLRRIALGLFMKVVVADTLARGFQAGTGVLDGFQNLDPTWNSLDGLALCAAYGFQIFFDFAGYSHVAIGSAKLLGLTVRENFDHPYLAFNISDFWNRWHMSLSSWIRDYLFFPLATLGSSRAWSLAALVVSMTLFGLWHGAAATFVLWGAYHGLLLAFHRWFQRTRRGRRGLRLPGVVAKLAGWLATFGAVTLGWTLFRATGLSQTAALLQVLANPSGAIHLSGEFYRLLAWAGAGYFLFAVALRGLRPRLEGPPLRRFLELTAPVGTLVLILLVIIWSDASSPFVYVRF